MIIWIIAKCREVPLGVATLDREKINYLKNISGTLIYFSNFLFIWRWRPVIVADMEPVYQLRYSSYRFLVLSNAASAFHLLYLSR
jgi:hypothetical protein